MTKYVRQFPYTDEDIRKLTVDVLEYGVRIRDASQTYNIPYSTARRIVKAIKENRTVYREPYPCGTYAAYTRHRRKKEKPCFDCANAVLEYQKKYRPEKYRKTNERLRAAKSS